MRFMGVSWVNVVQGVDDSVFLRLELHVLADQMPFNWDFHGIKFMQNGWSNWPVYLHLRPRTSVLVRR